MFAVRVEEYPGDLPRLGALEVDRGLTAVMSNDKFSSCELRGKTNDQRSYVLFAMGSIPMRLEESTLPVSVELQKLEANMTFRVDILLDDTYQIAVKKQIMGKSKFMRFILPSETVALIIDGLSLMTVYGRGSGFEDRLCIFLRKRKLGSATAEQTMKCRSSDVERDPTYRISCESPT